MVTARLISGLPVYPAPGNPPLPMRSRKNCTYGSHLCFDGDNVRHDLCSDLGFSLEDRSENIRRISEMVKLFLDAGVIALTAFISPLEHDRQRVRSIIGRENMLEIYCDCPLEICEQRDVKGLYKKARTGLIQNYTGISSPYEPPENPDLRLETGSTPLAVCIKGVISLLRKRLIIGAGSPPSTYRI